MIEDLGRYKILEEIGQGGFAIVYQALDMELERQVALKELRPTLLRDPEGVKRFKHEARTIARLDHPRIVTIFDVVEVAERLFIVMRLVDGLSLDRFLVSQHRLPWPQALEIMTVVAEALDYAHGQGILHRDLKPANILLDSRRGPLLSDFGLAKLVSDTSTNVTAGGIVGTPHYIAPEVWEDQGASQQSDIYGLGCIFYEILTGEKLFKGESAPAVMTAHFNPLALPNRWPEGVPPSVIEVFQKALAKTPSDRYTTAGEMTAALTRLTADQTAATSPKLKLSLFGSPQVELEGRSVTIKRRKALAILIYLAVTGEAQRRDTFAMLLWPNSSQSNARTALRRDLSALNRALDKAWLVIDRETVSLVDSPDLWLDIKQFQQQLAACQAHDHPAEEACPACLDRLTEAVNLYRDDFLTGFTLSDCPDFDEWQFFQTESLRQALATALEQLVDHHTAQSQFEPAIGYARRWLALDPLHEPAHRHLMQLYAQSGQQAAALRQYRLCVQTLETELGLSPAAETTALYERIRTEDLSQKPTSRRLEGEQRAGAAFAVPLPPEPLSFAPQPRHNLPMQATSFVGRAQDLAVITRRLDNPICRLLTLVGPGGIGKTRLAVKAVQNIVERPADETPFADGLYFVALAPVTSSDLLVSTIAEALDFTFYGNADPKTQLLNYLRQKAVLLMLDNFEHLLAGAALLSEILSVAPRLKLLVTSREVLNLQEEWLHQVTGLHFSDRVDDEAIEAYSAVQLFAQRAGRVRPDFSLAVEQRHVLRICQLVEGMPLGIELAAAWLKMFSADKVAREIKKSFDFLATNLRNVPPRQRSMRAVFAYSWELLSEAEQEVLKKLAVFRGGFRQDAAEQIAAASLPILTTLAEKSLLQTTASNRYQLHELLRQFAAEKLQTDPALAAQVQNQHCAFYLAFIEQQEMPLKGVHHVSAMEAIEAEVDNVRTAWNWAVRQGLLDEIERSLEGVGYFYEAKLWYEEGAAIFQQAAQTLQQAAPASQKQKAIWGKVLIWHGRMWFSLADILERPGAEQRAIELFQQSLSILTGLGRQEETGDALSGLSWIALKNGQQDRAEALAQRVLDLCQQQGDRWRMGFAFWRLGFGAWWQGKYQEAKQFFQQGIAVCRESGDRIALGNNLNLLGESHKALGEYEAAREAAQAALTARSEVNDKLGIAWSLQLLGDVGWRMGYYEEARERSEQSLAMFEETGQIMGLDFCRCNLGHIACALGDYQTARRHFRAILQPKLATNKLDNFRVADALLGMATILIKEENLTTAVELLELVLSHLTSWQEPRDRAGRLLVELEAQLSPEAMIAAQERAKSRPLADVVAELLGEAKRNLLLSDDKDDIDVPAPLLPQPWVPQPMQIAHNLPPPPTPFVGRADELHEIAERLTDPACRLLSLVGPGGIGKTRLAIQAAQNFVETLPDETPFSDGVYFVDLTAVDSPDLLVSTIAAALDFTFYGDAEPKAQLLDHLQAKAILLVLDNFEQLLAGATLISDLLAATAVVKCVVTSREVLNLHEEWLQPIEGLDFPESESLKSPNMKSEDYSAVQLFVQRAQRIQPKFSLMEVEECVFRLCQLVEGMPLGIELATTWLKTVSCQKLVRELEHSLDILTTRLRNLPERHRSMRAVFDYSWQLLTPEERDVLQRLSVFRGGFRHKAAEQVAGASLLLLTGLVEKSLLRPTPAGRYHLHELLRQFAEEKLTADLAEKEQVQDRHCAYYTTFLQQREAKLKGAGHLAAIDEIEAEIENVRAAWDWAVTQEKLDDLDRSLECLRYFHSIKCWHEVVEALLSQAAERLERDEPAGQRGIVFAKILAKLGRTQRRLKSEMGWPISNERTKELCQKSISILNNLGQPAETGDALQSLAYVAFETGDYEQAQDLNQEAFIVYKQKGDHWGMARALHDLGFNASKKGDYAAAKQFYRQSIAICEETGDNKTLGDVLNIFGEAHRALGEYAEARQLAQAALAARTAVRNKRGIAYSLYLLGDLAWRMGDYEEAKQRSQESADIFKAIGLERGLAFALNNLGNIACTLGDYLAARRYFQAIFKPRLAINDLENDCVPDALTGLATVLIEEGQPAQAVELLTLVLRHPAAWQEMKDRATSLLAKLEAQLPRGSVAMAQGQAKIRPLADVVAELLGEASPKKLLTDKQDDEEHMASPISPLPSPQSPQPPQVSHNLLPQLMPFVGRADELLEITRRLQDPACRLLSLVGPGGMGKTRLALQAAQSFIENPAHESPFPDGVYFVDLTPVSSPDLLVSTIAGALNFTFYGDADPKTQLCDYLREKSILLILDNFEQLLDGAHLITDLLLATSALKCLVTSREVLNLQEEWLISLEGLTFPPATLKPSSLKIEAYSAVQLFVQNARRVQPEFSLTEVKDCVFRLCQLVEGMPLGIELATTWLKTVSCQKLVQELEHSLDILTTRLRNLPKRHRSMRAVFDYSWQLLTPEERDVLQRLSIFRGGFRHKAAEQVAGATLLLLTSLVEKSLLRPNSAGRYHLHELLRQFAEEKLKVDRQELGAAQDRHCSYFTTLLQQQEDRLKGAEHLTAMTEIEADIENVRAAWDWAVTQGRLGDIDQSLESLALFHKTKCWHEEGEALFRKAAERLHDDEPRGRKRIVFAKVQAKQGLAQYWMVHEMAHQLPHEKIKALLQESLSILENLGEQGEVGKILEGLGRLANYAADYAAGHRLLHQALAVCEQQDDHWGMVEILEHLGYLGLVTGEYAQAKQFLQQGIAICEEIGSRKKLGDLLNILGDVQRELGEYEAARQAAQAALAARTESGNKRGIAWSLQLLGDLAWRRGDYEEAKQRSQESVDAFQAMGLTSGLGLALNNLGKIACTLGDYEQARHYFQTILKPRLAANALENDRVADALTGLATVLMAEGQPHQAVELLTLVLNHSTAWQGTKDRAAKLLAELEVQLSPQAVAAAKQRAEIRPLADVVAELLGEAGPSQPLSDERKQQENIVAPALPPQSPQLAQVAHNLAPQLTPFVGRATELLEIIGRLTDPACRLLTLVGPGGIGKTRLAIQAAQNFVETLPDEPPFGDGVYFVDLTAVGSPDLFVSTIAGALDFTFYGDADPKTQLLHYLREKGMLLILDNFEQLLDGAHLITDLLLATSAVKCLVTSREVLNLQEEWLISLAGLTFPPATLKLSSLKIEEYSAVQLFMQNARRVQPEFSLVDVKDCVFRLCQLVEGMPLGIELVTTWLKTVSCQKLVQELEHSLDILTTRLRNLPERHRSMRAVFDYSWQLLTPEERDGLQRLSVFRGGFRHKAAEQVAGASLLLLTSLAEKSLLRPNSAGRYHLHELLRQFAEEKLTAELAEKEQVQDRHCAYYSTFLQEREAKLKGAEHLTAVDEIEAEIENVRAAWDWAVAQEKLDDIDRSLECIRYFHSTKCWHEVADTFLSQAAERLEMDEPVGQRGIIYAKILAKWGQTQRPLKTEMGWPIPNEKIRELYQKSIFILNNLGQPAETGDALQGLASVAFETGDYEQAQHLNQEAFIVYNQKGDHWGMARALHDLGFNASRKGDYAVAKQFYRQSVAICEESGDNKTLGDVLNIFGEAHRALGEYAEARQLAQAALAARTAVRNKRGIAYSLYLLGDLAWRMGDYEEAKQRSQESADIFEAIGLEWSLAFALNNLGNIACTLGDYQAARQYYQAILKPRLAINDLENDRVAEALTGLAAVLIEEGQPAQAVELLTLVLRHPAAWQEMKDRATSLLVELEAQLSPEEFAAFGEQTQIRTLAEVVAEQLN